MKEKPLTNQSSDIENAWKQFIFKDFKHKSVILMQKKRKSRYLICVEMHAEYDNEPY